MKKYKKRIIWVIIILAVVAGGFFLFKGKKTKSQYTVEDAKRGDLFQTVSVTGTAEPENQVELSFKVSGVVGDMKVDVGDEVKNKQLLAKMNPDTLFWDTKQAEQDVEYQDETLSNMKDNRDTYDKDARDAQRVLVRKYEYALMSAKTKIGYTSLIAPIDGIITKRTVDTGEIAVANTGILTISEGKLHLKTKIPESDIVKVALGQSAEVTFDSLPLSEKFVAKVTKIDPAATVIQDVVYYMARIELDQVDSRLKSGMSADIDIRTEKRVNSINIPLRAVKTEGNKKYVEILKDEKNNITEKVYVSTGLEGDDGIVEITSGLKGGEKVITLTSTK